MFVVPGLFNPVLCITDLANAMPKPDSPRYNFLKVLISIVCTLARNSWREQALTETVSTVYNYLMICWSAFFAWVAKVEAGAALTALLKAALASAGFCNFSWVKPRFTRTPTNYLFLKLAGFDSTLRGWF